jgi:hypothetical protein
MTFARRILVACSALAAMAVSTMSASAQVGVKGANGGDAAGGWKRVLDWSGRLDYRDNYLVNDRTYFETRTVHLVKGRTYRLEVGTREFDPYLWVQFPGHISTGYRIVDAYPIVAFGPGGGDAARARRVVLTFTPHRTGNYTFVVNTMTRQSGSYVAVLSVRG